MREVIFTNWLKSVKNSQKSKPLWLFKPSSMVFPLYTPKISSTEILNPKIFSLKKANPSLLILALPFISITKISIKSTPVLLFTWLRNHLRICNFLSIHKCFRSGLSFMKCCMERRLGLQIQRKNSWKICFQWNLPLNYRTKNFRTSLKNVLNQTKKKEPNLMKSRVSLTNGKKSTLIKAKFSKTYRIR